MSGRKRERPTDPARRACTGRVGAWTATVVPERRSARRGRRACRELRVVNGFLSIRPAEKIEFGLDVNNLFDKLGFRGGGGLFPILSSTQAVFNDTALYGRTVTGSIRYRF